MLFRIDIVYIASYADDSTTHITGENKINYERYKSTFLSVFMRITHSNQLKDLISITGFQKSLISTNYRMSYVQVIHT